MTTQEKIIYLIRESLIEKYNEEFTSLSEKDQAEIISSEIKKAFEKI